MLKIIKQILQHITKNQHGYTLVELSISTSILALLAVGGLAVVQKKNTADKIRTTIERMNFVEQKLQGFLRINEYLPCPSDPSLAESSANFGTSTKPTAGADCTFVTGAVPAKLLHLEDEYTYDGWNRKLTYRPSKGTTHEDSFTDPGFRGNIRVIDQAGNNLTRIDRPEPNNQGAIYILISHGINGYNAAWKKNDTTPPSGALGLEAQNTKHTNNIYIRSEQTEKFDDFVKFAMKFDPGYVRAKLQESPFTIDQQTCDNAKTLIIDGDPAVVSNPLSSITDTSIENTTYEAAKHLNVLCDNQPRHPFLPSDIPNIILWLDANDKAMVFTDISCATSATANNDPIRCWQDKSGKNNHAKLIATNTPTYKLRAFNGKSVIEFNENNDYLVGGPLGITGTEASTVFVVFSRLPGSTGVDNLLNYGPTGIAATGSSRMIDIRESTNSIGWRTQAGSSLFTTSLNNNEYYIATGFNTSGDAITAYNLSINGLPQTTASGSGVVNTLDGEYSIGSYREAASGSFVTGASGLKGRIAEVVVYDRELKEGERKKIERYLSQKWHIGL